MGIKILLADDDEDIRELLNYSFKNEGYTVFSAENGQEALDIALKETPDVIILDIMMPIMDGVEASRLIRKMPKLQNKIIIFLTARVEEYSEVAGFEAGADDYITKPIKLMALHARIKNLLKRSRSSSIAQNDQSDIIVGNFKISLSERMVFLNEKSLQLPKKEFDILVLLTSKMGRVFTRVEIYEEIWGSESVVSERTLDVHIRKLREKIGSEYIRTSKGVGYAFTA